MSDLRPEDSMDAQGSIARGRLGTSGWAIAAAIVLGLVGIAVTLFGIVAAALGLAELPKPQPSTYSDEAIVIGLLAIVVGLVPLLASGLILVHRRSGRALGLLTGCVGALLGAAALWVEMTTVFDPPPGGHGPSVPAMLLPVPFVIVLVGLILGREQFQPLQE
jgi:hypothetical protein